MSINALKDKPKAMVLEQAFSKFTLLKIVRLLLHVSNSISMSDPQAGLLPCSLILLDDVSDRDCSSLTRYYGFFL